MFLVFNFQPPPLVITHAALYDRAQAAAWRRHTDRTQRRTNAAPRVERLRQQVEFMSLKEAKALAASQSDEMKKRQRAEEEGTEDRREKNKVKRHKVPSGQSRWDRAVGIEPL